MCEIAIMLTGKDTVKELKSVCKPVSCQAGCIKRFDVQIICIYTGGRIEEKSQSIWDTFTHEKRDVIEDHCDGDIACDSYHKFMADVDSIKVLCKDYSFVYFIVLALLFGKNFQKYFHEVLIRISSIELALLLTSEYI